MPGQGRRRGELGNLFVAVHNQQGLATQNPLQGCANVFLQNWKSD